MLAVSLLKSGFVDPVIINWNVGEHLDGNEMEGWEKQGFHISAVRASGAELAWVLSVFTNIPSAFGSETHTWRSETAQFIFDHLPRTWK